MVNLHRGVPSIYILRTFWDDRSPNELPKLSEKSGESFIELSMCGYAWKLDTADPSELKSAWTRQSPHQKGEYTYVVICAIPENKRDLLPP